MGRVSLGRGIMRTFSKTKEYQKLSKDMYNSDQRFKQISDAIETLPKTPQFLLEEKDPFNIVSSIELCHSVRKVLLTLTLREERVIRLRFGIGYNEGFTLDKIGEIIGASRERVRAIESKALRKLQHPTRAKYLKEEKEC